MNRRLKVMVKVKGLTIPPETISFRSAQENLRCASARVYLNDPGSDSRVISSLNGETLPFVCSGNFPALLRMNYESKRCLLIWFHNPKAALKVLFHDRAGPKAMLYVSGLNANTQLRNLVQFQSITHPRAHTNTHACK